MIDERDCNPVVGDTYVRTSIGEEFTVTDVYDTRITTLVDYITENGDEGCCTIDAFREMVQSYVFERID